MIRLAMNVWRWFDDRTGLSNALGPIMRHPVPPGTGWKYVLGSATLTAFLIQVVTGVALATIYNSSPNGAYQSLEFITHRAAMGRILRGMHWFGASAMFMLLAAHWTRTYLTGSYKFPREVNWMSGVLLVGCTVIMGYTGQLLRFDQNGVWSTIIAAEQAGRVPWIGPWLGKFVLAGDTVNAVTLSRYFAIHVFFTPALIFGLLGLHLYLVVRNGISESPKAGHPVDPKTYRQWYGRLLKRAGVPFWPDAIWRDAIGGLLVVAVVAGLALYIGPPELAGPPDATLVPTQPRPDWYLLWYYAVLALLPHYIEDFVIIGAPLAALLVLFFMPVLWNKGERAPSRRPWSLFVIVLVYFLIFWFWKLGKTAGWSPRFYAEPIPAQVIAAKTPDQQHGGELFFYKGCEDCHMFSNIGGLRGPDLTHIADRLTEQQIVIRVMNGGKNMPAFAGILKPKEVDDLIAFFESHKTRPFGPVE